MVIYTGSKPENSRGKCQAVSLGPLALTQGNTLLGAEAHIAFPLGGSEGGSEAFKGSHMRKSKQSFSQLLPLFNQSILCVEMPGQSVKDVKKKI